jgi:hypothetical protein
MKTITLRISDAEHEVLKGYATAVELTKNDVMRELIRSLPVVSAIEPISLSMLIRIMGEQTRQGNCS